MSMLKKYRETEKTIAELQERLRAMENDNALAREREFEEKLRGLMAEYGIGLEGLVDVLDPNYRKAAPVAAGEMGGKTRRQRQEMTFKNPHSGEEITVRSTNHNTIKAWKKQYGGEVVAGWKKA